jgi:hypothetical protein
MTEENATNGTTPETKTDTVGQVSAPVVDENIRNTPAFRAVIEQLNTEKAARLELENKQKQAADTAERERLEKAEDWKKLSELKDKEVESAKSEALKEILKSYGITDKYTVNGMVGDFVSGSLSISAFVEQVKSESPDLFQKLPFQREGTIPQGTRASQESITLDWKKIKEDHQSTDPKRVDSAIEALHKYKSEHAGQYPPGWR